MAVKYKELCKVCKKKWIMAVPRKYTICLDCQMRQIFSEEITDKKYLFLNLPREIFEKNPFLRDVRRSYLFYKDLTPPQVKAFKKTVKEMKKSKN